MRWEAIKQSWALAKKHFPDTKRLFVDLPDKYKASGYCDIIDLDKPTTPLGKMSYNTVVENNKPKISFQLEQSGFKIATQKVNMNLAISSKSQDLQKKMSITAQDIMHKYQSPSELAEKVAYLIIGHEDGLVKEAGTNVSDNEIVAWIINMGFPDEITGDVEDNLVGMGVKVAKKKPKKFENYEKIRVSDPTIMSYQEGGRIIKRKRDKENNDWYFVIVDGSEAPIWLNEKQIEKNTVGIIDPISDISRKKLEEKR